MTRLTYYHYDLDGKLIAGTRAGSVRVAVVGTDSKQEAAYARVMLPDDPVPKPRPRERFTPQGILIEDPPPLFSETEWSELHGWLDGYEQARSEILKVARGMNLPKVFIDYVEAMCEEE